MKPTRRTISRNRFSAIDSKPRSVDRVGKIVGGKIVGVRVRFHSKPRSVDRVGKIVGKIVGVRVRFARSLRPRSLRVRFS